MNKKNIFTVKTVSNMIVLGAGVLLYLLFSNFKTVMAQISWLYSIISPFVLAIAIAYLLNIPIRFLENKFLAKHKRKRVISLLIVYLICAYLLFLMIRVGVPQLIDSIARLVNSFSQNLNNLNQMAYDIGLKYNIDQSTIESIFGSYQDILSKSINFIRMLLPNLLSFTVQIGSSLIGIFTAIIASIYMLVSKEKLLRQIRRVIYAIMSKKAADEVIRIGRLSNRVFSGFISGKILDSAIIGIICFGFMSIMNVAYNMTGVQNLQMPYPLLISLIIGVANMIPFFGPFIGAIPSVMIILMVNPGSAIWFILFILLLQQFDGNYLGPKILGDSTGLPAMWVLIAIIVGGGLFGFMGMLLGVPTVAVLYTLASDIIENRLRRKGLEREPSLTHHALPPDDAPLPTQTQEEGS